MKVRKERGRDYVIFTKFIKDSEENKALKVGFLGKAEEPGSGFPVAKAAYISEFGFPKKNIPPRPYFRPAIKKNERKWGVYLYNQFKKAVLGELEFWQAFERLGLMVQSDIQQSIDAVHSPSLKWSTIRARYRRRSKGYKKAFERENKATGGIVGIRKAKKARDASGGGVGHSIEKPLIDTGTMSKNVSYIVEEAE